MKISVTFDPVAGTILETEHGVERNGSESQVSQQQKQKSMDNKTRDKDREPRFPILASNRNSRTEMRNVNAATACAEPTMYLSSLDSPVLSEVYLDWSLYKQVSLLHRGGSPYIAE